MNCPRCQHANRPDAAFCARCGGTLAPVCAGCGRLPPAGARFCDGCGRPVAPSPDRTRRNPGTPKHLADRIAAARHTLEGERKQVTVLFADVKGSMELAAQVDAEEWHRIMDRFFTILCDGVHRFEGTVNQFTGDGIMALFGAPVALEDHAQRACAGALHVAEALRRYADQLRRSRGLNFTVRMGLDSGEVVIGKIGDDLRLDHTALGQTVGLAARVEELAEAGRIYVSEHTARLVAGLFQLRDLGEFSVRGLPAALRLYELEGVGPLRTRLDVSRARGFSRFVGRDDEQALLDGALARALAGRGGVVGVVADPGMGKSRLCHEFAERCRAQGLPVYVAHAVPHGSAVPLVPVQELLRAYFGVAAADPPRSAREKIAGRLLLLGPELVDALPLLFDLLGIADPDDPARPAPADDRQGRLFTAVRHLVHAQGQREPAVTLLEDLHWLDAASEPFVENLVDAVAATRALLVVNFRPGYRARWMEQPCYEQLALSPLGAEAVAEMLGELLGSDPSVQDVALRIGERAAGNPFFVEEIVQALAGTGGLVGAKGAYSCAGSASAPPLPATVQAALAGRIDRLTAREKHVLQTAAVIGRTFGESLLRRVAELQEPELTDTLQALVGAELLQAAASADGEYAFKHPLTHEVAYHSQLGDRRTQLHGAVAAAVQALCADRLGEYASLIAHHWDAAGRRFEAARWRRRAALNVASIRVAVHRQGR